MNEMSTVCYYIPYSARAINLLKRISNRYNAKWSVNENEEVTITVKTRYLMRVEKTLAPIV